MNFPGVILITGSNGGIGCALAEYLLEKGIRQIALQYRSECDKITTCLKKFDLDPERHLFEASLTDESSVLQLRSEIESRIGEVWSVLNVAGGSTNSMSWKTSLADFRSVIDDNLTSAFLCSREFIPAMRKNAAGRIINFSSVVASTGIAGAAHYSAAKAGLLGLTKALALELAPKNITVNTLSLGYFKYGLINHLTEQLQDEVRESIPLKRFGDISEIGGYIMFLLSEAGQYTTGQTLHINGGLY